MNPADQTAVESAHWRVWAVRMAEARHWKRRAEAWQRLGRPDEVARCTRARATAAAEARRARASAQAVRDLARSGQITTPTE